MPCWSWFVCVISGPPHSLISTVGKALLIAEEIELDNVGVNMDTGHALMGFENLAESAVLLHRYKRLFYLHLNDNYRDWDYDMIVGGVHIWETLELLYWLNKLGYDGWYTLDLILIEKTLFRHAFRVSKT